MPAALKMFVSPSAKCHFRTHLATSLFMCSLYEGGWNFTTKARSSALLKHVYLFYLTLLMYSNSPWSVLLYWTAVYSFVTNFIRCLSLLKIRTPSTTQRKLPHCNIEDTDWIFKKQSTRVDVFNFLLHCLNIDAYGNWYCMYRNVEV
jgi:hypothetical protein